MKIALGYRYRGHAPPPVIDGLERQRFSCMPQNQSARYVASEIGIRAYHGVDDKQRIHGLFVE